MATAVCERCGHDVPKDAARCPACDAPGVGQPRKAPEGSGAHAPPEPERPRRGWDWAIIGAAALLVLVVVVVWLV